MFATAQADGPSGWSLEGCVAQTAIDARERGLLVTVVEPASARIDEKGAGVAVDYLRRVVGARVVSDVESCWRENGDRRRASKRAVCQSSISRTACAPCRAERVASRPRIQSRSTSMLSQPLGR